MRYGNANERRETKVFIFYLVGIYLVIRGIFGCFGSPLFYTKRTLEMITPEQQSTYLREIGVWNILTGVVFLARSILYHFYPGNHWFWIAFIELFLICVIYLTICNEKYLRKEK